MTNPYINPPYLRPDPLHEEPGLAPGTGPEGALVGLAKLLAARQQQGVENQQAQQRIDLQRTQQSSLDALRQQEADKFAQQTQDLKDARAAADTATIAWNGVVNANQQDDVGAVARAGAKLTDSRALSAFNALHGSYLEGVGKSAEAAGARAKADALLQQANLDKQIAPVLQRLMDSPTKLDDFRNPTVAQAMALKHAGVLDFILNNIEHDRQRAGENSQRDMLARQMVIDSYKQAQTEWGNWDFSHPQEKRPASFNQLWSQYLNPIGLDTTSAAGIISDAAKNLGKRRTDPKFADLPLAAPASLQPFIANGVYQQADATIRSHLLEAASAVARGAGALPPGLDRNTALWITGAAKAIRDSLSQRPPGATSPPVQGARVPGGAGGTF